MLGTSRSGRMVSRLIVIAVLTLAWAAPALAETAVFQEGLNGYASTVDTYIRGYASTSEFSTSPSVKWDGDDGGGLPNFVLVRFENIFGTSPGQIPPNAVISSATLTYEVFNSGNSATVNEAAVSWAETVTYTTFGGDPGVQADEYGAQVGTATGTMGTNTLNVTSSLVSWAANPSSNLGWIFRPTGGTDGVEFRSSEDGTASTRPKLTVNYTLITAVDITPANIDAVVGGANRQVTVSIPPHSNDTQAVHVTLTTDNAAVAVPVGASGNSLTITFAMGGPTQQNVGIDLGQAGDATITTTNDAGLGNDTLTVHVEAGAVSFMPTSVRAAENTYARATVRVTAGNNDTRAVQVTLTTDDASVAVPTGATDNSLVITFAMGGSNQQVVDLDIGAVGTATISTTNDGGLADSNLPVQVSTDFTFTATADPRDKATTFGNLLAAINTNVGGPGAFHLSVGDIDPLQPLRDQVDARFGPQAVWYPMVGNHEEETPDDMTWIRSEYTNGNSARTPLKNFTSQNGPTGCVETTYSWDYGNAHFIVLNEYWNGGAAPGSDVAANGDIVTEMYNWLAADLAANTRPVVFVFGHEPAYPFNRHIGDSLDQYPAHRDAFWNLLESEGVHAYVVGHTHYYSKYQKTADSTWQIDLGNAGNESSPPDGQTFLNVEVSATAVTYEIWRNAGGSWAMQESWTEPVGLKIRLSTQTITSTVDFGQNPSNDTFTVTSIGPGTLHYTVGDDQDWLSELPTEGESAGESDTITVSYSTAGLMPGEHTATITVSSDDAYNSPQTIAVSVTVKSVKPDFDADLDVDMEDFGHLQRCLSGTNVPQNDPACLNARLDSDTDVDVDDVSLFRQCASGPNVWANLACDD